MLNYLKVLKNKEDVVSNLLEGIKRLKECREKAKQAEKTSAEKSNNLAEIVKMYEFIVKKSEGVWGNKDAVVGVEMQDYEQIRKGLLFRWSSLTLYEQKKLVDLLSEKKLIPKLVRDVMDAFDGTIVRLV